MPSINAGDFGADPGSGFPWKTGGLVAIIVCALGYGVYQFAQTKPRTTAAKEERMPGRGNGDEFKTILEKLDLSDDQKSQVADIASETTNPVAFRRDVFRLLNPEQREKVKNMRAEIAEANRLRQERNKARMAKYYPGSDLAIAKEGNKQIRERAEARRKAAAAQKTGTAPAGTPGVPSSK